MTELLVKKFKDGEKLTDEQLSELGSFLEGEGGIKAVMDKFGYSKADYDRVRQALLRRKIRVPKAPAKPEDEVGCVKAPKEMKPEAELARHERKALADHIELQWKMVHDTAMKLIRKYEPRIIELGYLKEDGLADLERFLTDAIDFYIAKGRETVEIEHENVALWVSIELLSKMYNERLYQLNEARMAIYMTEMLNQDIESLPLLLTPIKTRLGMG
jgi:hypothetical protein